MAEPPPLLDGAGVEEAMVRLLEPHWRTDCSRAEPHAYVRWVRCRCGWESRRSSSLINAPDLHRIWIGHLVEVLLLGMPLLQGLSKDPEASD